MATGDSVMLGAAPGLYRAGIVVDALVSRQMRSMVPVMQQPRALNRLPDTVIVHLGNEGPPGHNTIDQFVGTTVDVARVIVLTDRAPRSDYIDANNVKLRALPPRLGSCHHVPSISSEARRPWPARRRLRATGLAAIPIS